MRRHLELDLHGGTPGPVQLTPAKTSKPAMWARTGPPGDHTVADRGYGQELRQLARLDAQDVRYVVRLRAGVTPAEPEELPVSAADRAAGVVRDRWVMLGRHHRVRGRVVTVRRGDTGEELRLATHLGPERLPGERVSLRYRQRWQVELCFRWFKCVLKAGQHWPWKAAGGVAAQLYLALLAGLLLSQRLGRRPWRGPPHASEGKGAVAPAAATGSAVAASSPSGARLSPLLADQARPTGHTFAATAHHSPRRNFPAGHNWLKTGAPRVTHAAREQDGARHC